MKKILLLILLVVSLYAKDKVYGSTVCDEVTSIYDADTFRCNIKSYPPIVGERVPIRVNGVDAPEMRGKCQAEKILARTAKQVTVSMLRNAQVIELRNMRRGKYFRIVADVYVDGKSLADELIRKHLAVEYHGGHKIKDWCR